MLMNGFGGAEIERGNKGHGKDEKVCAGAVYDDDLQMAAAAWRPGLDRGSIKRAVAIWIATGKPCALPRGRSCDVVVGQILFENLRFHASYWLGVIVITGEMYCLNGIRDGSRRGDIADTLATVLLLTVIWGRIRLLWPFDDVCPAT